MKRRAQRAAHKTHACVAPLEVKGATVQPDAAFYRNGAAAFDEDAVDDIFDCEDDGRAAYEEAREACHGEHLQLA